MLITGIVKDGEFINLNENVDLKEPTYGDSLEREIHNILSNLGLRQSNKGYVYLLDGIKKTIEDREYVDYITKVLYPYIAKKYKTTSSRVERAMRHAINTMPESDFRNKVFNYNFDHYTNKEFIVLIANYIQYN